jgi:hypothetical protein
MILSIKMQQGLLLTLQIMGNELGDNLTVVR